MAAMLTVSEDAVLPEVTRLRVEEGLTYMAIAERTGMPPETVRKLLGSQAVKEAEAAVMAEAAWATKARLAAKGAAVADKLASMALGTGDVDEAGKLDPVQLKACESVLDRIGVTAGKGGNVSVTVDNRKQLVTMQRINALLVGSTDEAVTDAEAGATVDVEGEG